MPFLCRLIKSLKTVTVHLRNVTVGVGDLAQWVRSPAPGKEKKKKKMSAVAQTIIPAFRKQIATMVMTYEIPVIFKFVFITLK